MTSEIWKDYMERIINEENDQNHNIYVVAVECPE